MTRLSLKPSRKLRTVPNHLMQILFLQNWRKNILDKYKIKIYPRAVRELDSIYEYIAVFRIDEPAKTVYVVTIQYQGRNL